MAKSDVGPDEVPADVGMDAGDEGDSATPPRRRRILRLSTLPTALTVGNLVCGILAISYVADASSQYALVSAGVGDTAAAAAQAVLLMERAGWLVMLGMVFDGLDGRVARMVHSTSEFGGALDSLADVVTFGVAPALIAKTLMQGALTSVDTRMTFLTAAFFAVCACLRLARYNAEHEEESTSAVDDFSGIPTPGAAGVIAGVAMVHGHFLDLVPDAQWKLGLSYVIGFGVLTGLGLLMVSRVPYVHFANRFLRGRKPVGRVALIFLAMMLVLNFDLSLVVAIGFAGYAVSGPLAFLVGVLRGKRSEIPEIFD
jgi:CDP-diacylglycerol--serine O-phosphatidyltransferase